MWTMYLHSTHPRHHSKYVTPFHSCFPLSSEHLRYHNHPVPIYGFHITSNHNTQAIPQNSPDHSSYVLQLRDVLFFTYSFTIPVVHTSNQQFKLVLTPYFYEAYISHLAHHFLKSNWFLMMKPAPPDIILSSQTSLIYGTDMTLTSFYSIHYFRLSLS